MDKAVERYYFRSISFRFDNKTFERIEKKKSLVFFFKHLMSEYYLYERKRNYMLVNLM